MKRTLRTTLLTTDALIAACGEPVAQAAAEPSARIDPRVLVVSDGGSATDAVAAGPDTTKADSAFGDAYTGGRSGWATTPVATSLALTLPRSAASSTAAGSGGSEPAADPPPDAGVPKGGAEPVPPAGS
ncbi:hypothetical protein [Streptomyces sp. bgisy027]|uniref:hypothetical protein n=1 Tax=unclassified Streptomyces TaxID=2593676 RepID=UPI003D719A0B